MTHDFDAAIEAIFNAQNINAETYNAAVFALKFTKAALSGEVSGNVVQSGLDGDDCIQSFTAMCQQLAKEVGNGNE